MAICCESALDTPLANKHETRCADYGSVVLASSSAGTGNADFGDMKPEKSFEVPLLGKSRKASCSIISGKL
jgi:hypothetical protein